MPCCIATRIAGLRLNNKSSSDEGVPEGQGIDQKCNRGQGHAKPYTVCIQQDIVFYSEFNRKTMEGYNNLVNVGPTASSS